MSTGADLSWIPDDVVDDAPVHERISVMRCARCNHPIAAAADLLPEQVPRLESASYPYQLDLLGNEEAWVYSATNAQQHRFDVCRFGVNGVCVGRRRRRAPLRLQGSLPSSRGGAWWLPVARRRVVAADAAVSSAGHSMRRCHVVASTGRG